MKPFVCRRKVAGSQAGRAKTCLSLHILFLSLLTYISENINCHFIFSVKLSFFLQKLEFNTFKHGYTLVYIYRQYATFIRINDVAIDECLSNVKLT